MVPANNIFSQCLRTDQTRPTSFMRNADLLLEKTCLDASQVWTTSLLTRPFKSREFDLDALSGAEAEANIMSCVLNYSLGFTVNMVQYFVLRGS